MASSDPATNDSMSPNESHSFTTTESHESLSLLKESELELTAEQQQTLIAHWDDPFALYRHTKDKLVATAILNRRLRVQKQMAAHTETNDNDPPPICDEMNSHSHSSETQQNSPSNEDEKERHPLSEWRYLSLCISQLLTLNNQNVSYHLLAIQIYQSYPQPTAPEASEYLTQALRSCDLGIELCLIHLDGHHSSFYLWITTFYVLRAQILFQQREWQKVIDSVLPALKYQQSDNIHLLYNLRASAFCELKQFDAAISDYGLAIDRADEPSSYHNSRGTCWHELGEYETALSDYNVAIDRNAQCVSAYNNRSSLFVDMGQYQRALDDANTGLAIYSNHGNLYKHRAVAHFHLRHFEECLLDLQKSIRFAPRYRPARVTLKMVWDFYYHHLAQYVQHDICRLLVDYMVGDNYHTDDTMVNATYADWKKEMALVEEERKRQHDEQQQMDVEEAQQSNDNEVIDPQVNGANPQNIENPTNSAMDSMDIDAEEAMNVDDGGSGNDAND